MKEQFKSKNTDEALSLWMSIEDLLLRPISDGASGIKKGSLARDTSKYPYAKIPPKNTQDIPPYENSVLHTFLKIYPKSQGIVLFKKVKGHIE